MKSIKLSCSHALIKYLVSQKIIIENKKMPLFPGAFGIYGHGNVACIGQAMEEFQKQLPGYRGHHEQNMALTGIGYARAMRRKQIFIATSSVGPGSTNMVTAAAVALSNRLPILLLQEILFQVVFLILFYSKSKILILQQKLKMIHLKQFQNISTELLDQNKFYLLYLKRLIQC